MNDRRAFTFTPAMLRDLLQLIALLLIFGGVSARWGWALGCVVAGVLLLGLALLPAPGPKSR